MLALLPATTLETRQQLATRPTQQLITSLRLSERLVLWQLLLTVIQTVWQILVTRLLIPMQYRVQQVAAQQEKAVLVGEDHHITLAASLTGEMPHRREHGCGIDAQLARARQLIHAACALEKLIEVVKLIDITGEGMVARELALIKVHATSSTRSEIIQIVDIFRAKIVDVAPDSIIIEATGDEEKIDSLYSLLRKFGIKELARTGRIALQREGGGVD